MGTPEKKPVYLLQHMLCGGLAASWAEFCTLPFDTAKVRLQIQGQPGNIPVGQAPKYRGMLHCMMKMSGEEGFTSLYRGLVPGIQRQLVFASLRIGLFDPILKFYCPNLKKGENPPLIKKIAAGLTTGAFGITVANPTDVVKIRMQNQGRPGEEIRYKNWMNCYSKIVQQESVIGLWTGWIPNVMRNSIINAAELASYFQIKQTVLKYTPLKDNILCHFVCGLGAGTCALIAGNPIDVIKTRLMNKTGGYTGAFDCAWQIIRNEGPFAFYKGCTANLLRLSLWNTVMFVTLEQLRLRIVPGYGSSI